MSSQLAAAPWTSKPADSAEGFEGDRCGGLCGRPADYCPYSSKEGRSQGDVQQAGRVGPSSQIKLAEHWYYLCGFNLWLQIRLYHQHRGRLIEDVDCFELVHKLCGSLHDEFMEVFQIAIPDLPEVLIFALHSVSLMVQTC